MKRHRYLHLQHGNIYTITPDGKNLHAVTNDARISADSNAQQRFYQFPTWSPHGRRLAFIGTTRSGTSDSTVSLYTADPDGRKPVEVNSSGENLPFYLYWSPDSQHLSFLTSGEGQDLFCSWYPHRVTMHKSWPEANPFIGLVYPHRPVPEYPAIFRSISPLGNHLVPR